MQLKEQTIKEILHELTGLNVSDKAVIAFGKAIDEYMKELADNAARFAGHAKRKTLREEDILLAREIVD